MNSEFLYLNYFSLACAAAAASILIYYLVRRPVLAGRTKLLLFVGLGPLPITAAMVGNVSNFEVTKNREFCASCHVMTPYNDDASDPKTGSLASIHSQNPYFGKESCYICHADYGMFGMAVTKLGGMRHVWYYYTQDWNDPAHEPPKILKPFPSKTCMQCHPQNRAHQPLEHQVHGQAIESGEVTCTSAGCHGRPHPDAAVLHARVKR